uniref:dolichyl-phosphate-mannose--protein mannosyltransferase n=1 Tax=Crassostrea virginica TaxID=6565 RepID=A0A8B8A6W3_CRAVI|nr:transmembrane and TPR repeat-containing protein 3-like isoform X2 [Crassostrea virginica]
MEHHTVYSAVLVVTVAVCYYKALGCGFVFDDMSAIVENKDLRPRTPIVNLFWNDFWGTPMKMEKSHKSYRPLCVLTFRLNYAISELEPMSYHLVNVVLHAIVCLLFMKVCNMFLREFTSFVAALLFAVHPIHTEAVTGVVGRAEALSSIFFLAALIMYSNCTSYHGRIKWPPLLGTVVMVTIAMLCKEQGITVIGVCCVYEVFVAQRASFPELLRILLSFVRGKPHIPSWLKNSVVRAVFLVGTTVFLLLARIKVMGAQLPIFTRYDNPASMENTPARQLTFNYLLPINAWLLLFPSGLCCDWTMGTIPVISSILDPRNLFTLLFYAVMGKFVHYMLQAQDKRNRVIIMSFSLLVLPFVPASNLFFPVGFVVAERILYTPSMGFSMLVALGFQILLDNKQSLKPFLWGMLGFLLLTHSVKTFIRNGDWESEYSIFRSALKVNTKNAKLFNNVGHALEKYAKYAEALEYFEKAVSVQQDDIGAHINVGRTYNNLNMSREAEAAYKKALSYFPQVQPGKSYQARIAPNHLNVYLNLASLVGKDPSRLMEADKYLKTAVSMRPDYVQGYINRGDILVKQGQKEEALKVYRTALHYEPDNADVLYNIGVVLLELGKPEEARKNFEAALHHDPDHSQSLYNSAIMIQESGEQKMWAEGIRRLQKLIKREPEDPKYYFTLGMIHMDMQNYQEAERDFKNCIKYDPLFRSALFNLALMLNNNLNRPLDAIPYLETLIKNYPEHTKALLLMGDINVNALKKLDEAERNFARVVELEPDNVQAHHNLCVVHVERGDLIRAEKCLTKVHNMAPTEKYIINHLNIVRSKLNELIKKRQEEMQKKGGQTGADKQKGGR